MSKVTVTDPKGNLLSGEEKVVITRGNKPETKPAPESTPKAESPPPEPAPAKKAPTPEELEQQRLMFQERMWGKSGVGSKAKVKEEAKPEPKDKAKEEAKPDPEKEEDPRPEPKPAKIEKVEDPKKPDPKKKEDEDAEEDEDEEEDDEDDFAALQPAAPKKPEPSKQPTMAKPDQSVLPENLNQKQKRYIRNLEELEQINPRRYSGIAKKAMAFWEMEAKKIEEWEKAHPGESYDPSAQEHAAWYDKHQPDIDEDDLEEAKEVRIQKEAEAKAVATTNEIASKQDAKLKMREVEPEVLSVANRSKFDLIELAAPELFEMTKVNGKPTLSKEIAEKITDHDPIAAEVLNEVASRVDHFVYELEYLTRFPRHYEMNPDKVVKLPSGERMNPHSEIVSFMETLENDMASLPKEKSMKGTKKFVTHAQYNSRVRSIKESNLDKEAQAKALGDLQLRYWTLGPLDVRKAYVADQAEQAMERIQKLNSLADRKYKKSSKSQEDPAKLKDEEAGKQKEDEPANGVKQRKQVAPASISSSDKLDTSGKQKGQGQSNQEIITKKMWG